MSHKRRIHNREPLKVVAADEAAKRANEQKVLAAIALLSRSGRPFTPHDVDVMAFRFSRRDLRGRGRSYCRRNEACWQAYQEAMQQQGGKQCQ